jgi:hypothetical protein
LHLLVLLLSKSTVVGTFTALLGFLGLGVCGDEFIVLKFSVHGLKFDKVAGKPNVNWSCIVAGI